MSYMTKQVMDSVYYNQIHVLGNHIKDGMRPNITTVKLDIFYGVSHCGNVCHSKMVQLLPKV